jgi:hypothetical protein
MEDPDLKTVISEGRREWVDISEDLHKPVPDSKIDTKRKGGAELKFIPWYQVNRLLHYYTNGYWHYEVTAKEVIGDRLCLTVQIVIESQAGKHVREATGSETLDTDSYGDFQSNAESMAFRRAAARFGLGLHLYNGG